MKNITLIFFLLFLYSCGYTSIYKNKKSKDFLIETQIINMMFLSILNIKKLSFLKILLVWQQIIKF